MKNRDMFYQNLNQGYTQPGGYIEPSGYNLNTQYQTYGPNVNPYQQPQGYIQGYNDDLENRFNRIDKQINNLNVRLQKLENAAETTDENLFII